LACAAGENIERISPVRTFSAVIGRTQSDGCDKTVDIAVARAALVTKIVSALVHSGLTFKAKRISVGLSNRNEVVGCAQAAPPTKPPPGGVLEFIATEGDPTFLP
jgi:hypothetical protein